MMFIRRTGNQCPPRQDRRFFPHRTGLIDLARRISSARSWCDQTGIPRRLAWMPMPMPMPTLQPAVGFQQFCDDANLQINRAKPRYRIRQVLTLVDDCLARLAIPRSSFKVNNLESWRVRYVLKPGNRYVPAFAAFLHKLKRFLAFLAGVGECDFAVIRKSVVCFKNAPQHVCASAPTAEADAGVFCDLKWIHFCPPSFQGLCARFSAS